jgi:hypothetical protein
MDGNDQIFKNIYFGGEAKSPAYFCLQGDIMM